MNLLYTPTIALRMACICNCDLIFCKLLIVFFAVFTMTRQRVMHVSRFLKWSECMGHVFATRYCFAVWCNRYRANDLVKPSREWYRRNGHQIAWNCYIPSLCAKSGLETLWLNSSPNPLLHVSSILQAIAWFVISCLFLQLLQTYNFVSNYFCRRRHSQAEKLTAV